MNLTSILKLLGECPLVVSVQAPEGSPLRDDSTLVRLALASANEGVRLLRAEGPSSLQAIARSTGLPVMGLIKRTYEGSPVYITPTLAEVEEVLSAGCRVVALDGTGRPRPREESLSDLVRVIHQAGAIAVGDCDTLDSIRQAVECGVDLVSTTLAGYTAPGTPRGPDIELVRRAVREFAVPVLAEGRFQEPWEVQAALRSGAAGVVIGGAINDPVKQTKRFLGALPFQGGRVGAVDLGGTWLRCGLFTSGWELLESDRAPTPPDPQERLIWIRSRLEDWGVVRAGVSSGGVIDPQGGRVVRAKDIIPRHVGSEFSQATLGVPTLAANDGHASAYAHACLPENAGRRVATLALGTGVGFGLVERGDLWRGPSGEPPGFNDVEFRQGRTYEEVLGGASRAAGSEGDAGEVEAAFDSLVELCQRLFLPDRIYVCGSVGLAMSRESPAVRSPFGEFAGLYGAAALALYTPTDWSVN